MLAKLFKVTLTKKYPNMPEEIKKCRPESLIKRYSGAAGSGLGRRRAQRNIEQ